MPYRNPTNKMLWLVLGAGLAFWALPLLFAGSAIQEVLNSLVFGVATVVLFTWGPSAYYSLRGNVTAEHQHIVSTVAIWLIVWTQRLYAVVFMSLDRPHWLQVSAWPAFITYMFGMMGILIIAAPFFVKDIDQRGYYWQLGVGLFIGTILAIISYVTQTQ
jgi:hypothetical protein